MAAVTATQFTKIHSLEDLLPHLKVANDNKKKVLVLDLDETLIQGKPTLGNEPFYDALAELNNSNGRSWTAHYAWTALLREKITYECCETAEKVNRVLSEFRAKGWDVIGLTSRGEDMKDLTATHLASAGINLPIDEIIFKSEKDGEGNLLGKGDHLTSWKNKNYQDNPVEFLCVDDDKKRALPSLKAVDGQEDMSVICVHMERTDRPEKGTLPDSDWERVAVQLNAYVQGKPIPYGDFDDPALKEALAQLEIPDTKPANIYQKIAEIAGKEGHPFGKPKE
ncbi:MAG: DUF2608 domain-containing protein [Simkaniaceae bacterium]|nr:DUF2608 domain-containing protein [Candidatus Sacchlamyda saccharinae]